MATDRGGRARPSSPPRLGGGAFRDRGRVAAGAPPLAWLVARRAGAAAVPLEELGVAAAGAARRARGVGPRRRARGHGAAARGDEAPRAIGARQPPPLRAADRRAGVHPRVEPRRRRTLRR